MDGAVLGVRLAAVPRAGDSVLACFRATRPVPVSPRVDRQEQFSSSRGLAEFLG